MTGDRTPLEVAIARATAPDSPYWSFRDLDGADPEAEQLVEVRLNMSPNRLASFSAGPDWTVSKMDSDGIVYMRRSQKLSDHAVKAMIAEALALADANGGQFWSWMHGSALDA